MTNYNERLGEIFAPLIDSPSLTLTTAYWDEAKQALTSLTKELVAEAKPEKHIHHHADGKPFKDAQDIAYNAAIDQFEHNLLKALEEI